MIPVFLRVIPPLLALAVTAFGQPALAADSHHHKPAPKKHAHTPYVSHALSKEEAALARSVFAWMDKGNWSAARNEARRSKDPVLAKLVEYYALIDPNVPSTFEEIQSFARSNPDWPRRGGLTAKAEAQMPETMAPEAVVNWFDGDQPVSAAGEIRFARALIETGKTEEGTDLLRKIWVTRNLTRELESVMLDEFGQSLRPEDHARRLERLIWDEQIDAANRMLARVDPDLQALARARIALIQDAGNVDTLIGHVPDALQSDPGLLYERIRWRRRHDQNDDALALLLQAPPGAVVAHPDKWWTERHYQARKALAAGDATTAYELAAAHGGNSGLPFVQGEFLAGWLALRYLDKPATALEHFTRLEGAATTPSSHARAAYWAARAADALGKSDDARQWRLTAAQYSTTFYGQLATLDLGRRHIELPEPPDPPRAMREKFESFELVRALHYIEAAGEDDKARPFVTKLTEIAPNADSLYLLAEIPRSEGRPEVALNVAREAALRGVVLPEHAYPILDFSPRAAGGRTQPERALVLAISRQESAFNHRAVSPAGALGLMQLMPTTARQLARSLKMKFAAAMLTKDARYNATLGSAFLGDMIDNLGGSYLLSIAAYNAGPGRVRQWIRDFGDPRDGTVDPVDWIERIPFSETRDYVQRVLENLEIYRLRLGEKPDDLRLNEDLHRARRTTTSQAGAVPAVGAATP